MGKEQQIATWMFMILTATRKQLGLSQTDFPVIIKKYKVVNFLSEHYELLHYYDNEYIINDVMKYLEEQTGYVHID